MQFPEYFHQTGYESDRMFIEHRLSRFDGIEREEIVEDYVRRYRTYGRDHANAWLNEMANKKGDPISPERLAIQQRLERLNQLSRKRRDAREARARDRYYERRV